MTANQRKSLRGAKRRGNPFLHKTENLQISHKEWGFATFFAAGIVIRCIRKIMRKLRTAAPRPPLQGVAQRAGGRKGALPVAEPSDRSGWAGTWFCTSKAQGKTLVPTRTVRKAAFPTERNSVVIGTTPRPTSWATPLERGDEAGSCHCEGLRPVAIRSPRRRRRPIQSSAKPTP